MMITLNNTIHKYIDYPSHRCCKMYMQYFFDSALTGLNIILICDRASPYPNDCAPTGLAYSMCWNFIVDFFEIYNINPFRDCTKLARGNHPSHRIVINKNIVIKKSNTYCMQAHECGRNIIAWGNALRYINHRIICKGFLRGVIAVSMNGVWQWYYHL